MPLQLHNDADFAEGIRLRIRAAEVHINRQEYTRGLQELNQSLEVCTQKGYREMGEKARERMAFTLRELGNFEAALSISKETKSEFKAMGHVDGVALALNNKKSAKNCNQGH